MYDLLVDNSRSQTNIPSTILSGIAMIAILYHWNDTFCAYSQLNVNCTFEKFYIFSFHTRSYTVFVPDIIFEEGAHGVSVKFV